MYVDELNDDDDDDDVYAQSMLKPYHAYDLHMHHDFFTSDLAGNIVLTNDQKMRKKIANPRFVNRKSRKIMENRRCAAVNRLNHIGYCWFR